MNSKLTGEGEADLSDIKFEFSVHSTEHSLSQIIIQEYVTKSLSKTPIHVFAHVISVSNILSHLSQRSIQTHSREFFE